MVKVGDKLTRVMGGMSDEGYIVTSVAPERIIVTNPKVRNVEWSFDSRGREIDSGLRWGYRPDGSFKTGSYLIIHGVEPPTADELFTRGEIIAQKMYRLTTDRKPPLV